MLNYPYGGVFVLMATIGSLGGTLLVQKLVETTKRNSISDNLDSGNLCNPNKNCK